MKRIWSGFSTPSPRFSLKKLIALLTTSTVEKPFIPLK